MLMFVAEPVLAGPPSGYACAPGTTNKGVGCTCPAKFREKRDAENVALCATAPTPNVSAQLLGFADKANVDAAIALAKKYEFKDMKTLQAVVVAFVKWAKPRKEETALLASRGQCSAIGKITATGTKWTKLMTTMIGKRFQKDEEAQYAAADAIIERLDPVLAPLDADRTACIATASKDDGSVQIKAAYDANRAPIAKCFEGLTLPKVPMTAKIVVDADGAVAQVDLTVAWPGLDKELEDQDLEMARLTKLGERELCFGGAIQAWKLNPTRAASLPPSRSPNSP
ncbi:MAG: hypothetical protein H0V17_09650 [Deltaproteobacteria bacterium]|nr:hypothetical protein [Deltaproteobacteria bacterium]